MRRATTIILAAVCAIACVGCNDRGEVVEETDVGVVIVVEVLQGNFSSSVKTVITTDEMVITQYGAPAIRIGASVKLRKYANRVGGLYVWIEGCEYEGRVCQ